MRSGKSPIAHGRREVSGKGGKEQQGPEHEGIGRDLLFNYHSWLNVIPARYRLCVLHS